MAADAEIVIDARGHRCPVPTLRLRRAAEGAMPGAVLNLICDDPLARIDVPHFADVAGLELLSVSGGDERLVVRVRKPHQPQNGEECGAPGGSAPPGLPPDR